MSVRKPLVLFTVLAVYILAQFVWWGYLLHTQAQLISAMKSGEETGSHRDYSIWMILSEGGVFLLIVGLLLFIAYRSYKRELRLVKTKDNFLMAVTHELRTPIAGMRLNMQTLEREDLEPEMKKLVLSNAIEDSKRLQKLANQILLAAKSNTEIAEITGRACDISKLSEEICSQNESDVAAEHRIVRAIDSGILTFIDPVAYRSILQNLIENACKYSPAGSSITVSLHKEKSNAVLSVADEGSGITDKEKVRVFEKFFRGGNENTRTAKGTGLGLYIVKRFTERFGGAVSVCDNKPKGTKFSIQLPLNKKQ